MGIRTNKTNKQIAEQTNATNLQIAQETNAANQAINQANIDYAREAWESEVAYNWEMWNATNEYNSAASQVERLREAGLNPYLMMDGGSAGTGSSESSPTHNQPNQLPMQAAKMEPYYYPNSNPAQDLMSIAQAVGSINQVQKSAAEVESININNQYLRQRNAAELANIIANTRNLDAKTRGQVLDNVFSGESLNSRVLSAKMNPHFMQYQMNEMQSRIDLNQINRQLADAKLPYVSQQAYADVQATLARAERDKSGRYLDYMKAREAVANTLVKNQEYNNMPKFTPEQAKKIATTIMAEYDTTYSRNDLHPTWKAWMSYIGSLTGSLGNIFSGAGTSLLKK